MPRVGSTELCAMEITWKASFSASCLHAAACLADGLPIVDREFAELVAEPADLLVTTLKECSLEPISTLRVLTSWASHYENNRELVQVALSKLRGPGGVNEQLVSMLAAAIGNLETRILAARPELVEELALRGRPLQEQWNARGPGLLKQIARLTEESFVAPAAEVVLVQPVVGGAGYADLKSNRVLFEAVLTNPHAAIPEALRLGWLLAQLNADLPTYAEAVSPDMLPRIAALATLPVALSAAETVEWATCDLATIELALGCWHLPSESPQQTAEQVFRWWQAYDGGSTTWPVAWRALESLLR
jgi:hypothetical protein